MRIATSQISGQILQYLATFFACLGLALGSCWSLTLVILAAIPVTAVMTIVCEIIGGPLLVAERAQTAKSSALVERVVNAIATVKAFNAGPKELARFRRVMQEGGKIYVKSGMMWGARLGLTTTLMLIMFVQGFWYGSHLVQSGKTSAGTVMTVFWSSLLASSHLQMIIQSLNIIEKGKVGMAGLASLINPPQPIVPATLYNAKAAGTKVDSGDSKPSKADNSVEPSVAKKQQRNKSTHAVHMSIGSIPSSPVPTSPKLSPKHSPRGHLVSPRRDLSKRGAVVSLRRIRPNKSCQGEFVLRNLSFAYASRPDVPVLQNIDMYLPAGETTYIVGGSGSGKSTIAQLLLRLYEPNAGSIELDDQDMKYLDPDWCRENVAAVSQSPIIFDLSVHDNVALGSSGVQATSATARAPTVPREVVIDACRLALLHEFVRDLPEGYETQLGQRGASLSGGQKQRLAIARAKIRDPTVLILDEATSALDPTSRLLVHEAIKSWRRGRTTIVITHDLAQVGSDDFVYLLEKGRVRQQGYRTDLESKVGGRFCEMVMHQKLDGGDDKKAPVRTATQTSSSSSNLEPASPTGLEAQAQPVMAALTNDNGRSRQDTAQRWAKGMSLNPLHAPASELDGPSGDVGSFALSKLEARHHGASLDQASQPRNFNSRRSLWLPKRLAEQEQKRAAEEANFLEQAGVTAISRRPRRELDVVASSAPADKRRKWAPEELEMQPSEVKINMQSKINGSGPSDHAGNSYDLNMTKVLGLVWRTQPSKQALVVGLGICVLSGGVTPVFSYLLAQLLGTMGKTDQSATVLRYAVLVLLCAFVDGILAFLRVAVMEVVGDRWIRGLREKAYALVLAQDKAWFDKPDNSAGKLCNSIIKDAEDARSFVGTIIGQLVVAVAMVMAGMVWALIEGWQLTLVGMAFGPVFIVAMTLQSRLVNRYEGRNKLKREEVAKRFYDMVANVRGIRAMALEPAFAGHYKEAINDAQHCGIRAAAFSGFGFGLGEALTYLAEALMYYVGAVLIIKGTYDFTKMVIVFNLIIFAVTFAAQTMAYLPGLSKSMRATADLGQLLALSTESSESHGADVYPIKGKLSFRNVDFSYPTRSDVPVLKGVSFDIGVGECVAVVGSSGGGKSTITALLQRLYEPSGGQILLDGQSLAETDVHWLREHISIVSQHPNLFDMSIADNIAYGANAKVYEPADPSSSGAMAEIVEAAKAANVDEFVSALPKSYGTSLGENASLVSGGQAQRLAIARALMRTRAKVLILDECTSALDAENQEAVVQTLMEGEARQRGFTTIVVTHKLDLMRRCDRVLVLDKGRIVQQGSYNELIAQRGGCFAALASGGEWGA